jgi:hypothetical protein
MENLSFDPGFTGKLALRLRIRRAGSVTFTFLDASGAAYTVNDKDYELFVKKNAGNKKDVISLLTSYAGFGLTFPAANKITATVTPDQTDLKEGEYYWELLCLDTNKTMLCGPAYLYFENE